MIDPDNDCPQCHGGPMRRTRQSDGMDHLRCERCGCGLWDGYFAGWLPHSVSATAGKAAVRLRQADAHSRNVVGLAGGFARDGEDLQRYVYRYQPGGYPHAVRVGNAVLPMPGATT